MDACRNFPVVIDLGCFGIVIRLDAVPTRECPAFGSITSDLTPVDVNDNLYRARVDALEALILAHACGGVDVTSPAYIEGIETAVEVISTAWA